MHLKFLVPPVVLATFEVAAVAWTDTWLAPAEWLGLWFFAFAMSWGALSAAAWTYALWDDWVSQHGRHMFESLYRFSALFILSWIGLFLWWPELHLVAHEIASTRYLLNTFLSLVFCASTMALLHIRPQWERIFDWVLFALWVVFLPLMLYRLARGSYALVHLAGLGLLFVALVRIMPKKPYAMKKIGLACAALALVVSTMFSHRLSHAVVDRTRLFFHAKYMMAWARDSQPEGCEILADPQETMEDLVEDVPPPVDTEKARARGVLVVFIDALRADRIGMVYKGHPLTPNLEEFSEEAVHFTSSYTIFPSTIGMIASLGSGRYDAPDGQFLGEHLKKHGVSFDGHWAHEYLQTSLGDAFDGEPLGEPSAENEFETTSDISTDKAIEYLQSNTDERFVYVAHYYDPHEHYVPNDRFDFGPGLEDRYNAEVALVDFELGRLFKHVPDDVAVLVMSDHGDELGEHGFYYHGIRVYDGSTRILTYLKAPGLAPGDYHEPVSSVDFAPTIAELLGIEFPRAHGISLLHPAEDRRVFVRGIEKAAIVSDEYKVIWNYKSRTMEVYDRKLDPDESKNLADEMIPDLCEPG